jgi:hypothetical protein
MYIMYYMMYKEAKAKNCLRLPVITLKLPVSTNTVS